MRALAGSVCLLCACAGTARAFEWDDGRSPLPFRPTVTRHYVAATDLEHMRRGRARRTDNLAVVSASRPAHAQILRSAFSGGRRPPPPDIDDDAPDFRAR